jgi:hypothetical protein
MKEDIIYQDPRHDLSQEDIQKYHEKIKPFAQYSPNNLFIKVLLQQLSCNDHWFVEYLKTSNSASRNIICHKCPYTNNIDHKCQCNYDNRYTSYGCYSKYEPIEKLDVLDKKFIESEDTADLKIELYSLHKHWPNKNMWNHDLDESINILSTKIHINDLESVERIYVTIEPHPANDVFECYDFKNNMYKGKTTYYIYNHKFDENETKKRKIT